MNNEQLKEKITSANFTVEFEENPQFLFLIVTPENFRSLMEILRDDPELNFDFLFCVTGVDWITHLMVVYNLNTTQHNK
jgi:NADH:ubiquinone oxidoreductase subunit C